MILKLLRPALFVMLVLAMLTGQGAISVLLSATMILIGEPK